MLRESMHNASFMRIAFGRRVTILCIFRERMVEKKHVRSDAFNVRVSADSRMVLKPTRIHVSDEGRYSWAHCNGENTLVFRLGSNLTRYRCS